MLTAFSKIESDEILTDFNTWSQKNYLPYSEEDAFEIYLNGATSNWVTNKIIKEKINLLKELRILYYSDDMDQFIKKSIMDLENSKLI